MWFFSILFYNSDLNFSNESWYLFFLWYARNVTPLFAAKKWTLNKKVNRLLPLMQFPCLSGKNLYFAIPNQQKKWPVFCSWTCLVISLIFEKAVSIRVELTFACLACHFPLPEMFCTWRKKSGIQKKFLTTSTGKVLETWQICTKGWELFCPKCIWETSWSDWGPFGQAENFWPRTKKIISLHLTIKDFFAQSLPFWLMT